MTMIKKFNENLSVIKNRVEISEECVNFILKDVCKDVEFKLISFNINCASDNMIGFLSDYWKLEVNINLQENKEEKLHFFIKAMCYNVVSKAAMVKEMNLFNKEILFYDVIKRNFNMNGLKKWSPNLLAYLDDAMIYEDLTYLGYKNRNKLCRFDLAHTLQALETLATFHSTSLIYEENKRKNIRYSLYDEYEKYLDVGGYSENSLWFVQCMSGALEAVHTFSRHQGNVDTMKLVEQKWKHVWFDALKLCNYSTVHRNVICHRDLWNNNLLFHYKENNEPDDCIFVDYQAVKLQPPAGDVMTLLHCNLDSEFREKNLDTFLSFYYDKLRSILQDNEINIDNILPKSEYLVTIEKQRKWGLIVSACLIPQIMLNDELITKIFTDTERFEDIMTMNKGNFIKEMIKNNKYYKDTVMEIFDEIIDRYIINES